MPLVRKQTPGGSVNGGSELLAVLHVSGRRDGEPFTEGDLKTLSIIANHTSAALQNARLIRDVEEAHLATLESMASLLEAKDAYTHGHSQRVRSYAKAVAERFGLPQEDVDAIDLGAALHDIGKVGVHDSVLTKVEALTSEEFESIKQHPLIGYDILKTVRFLAKPHLDLVRSHHERYDGSGYPDRLQGEAIPVGVRILSVADAYDAMTSNRAYRQALPKDKVVSELQDHAGRQFDPAVVTLFVELIREGLPPQGA
jgi:HD-GYP domain-containing protein (c-di-GMP phosphodiesterase class II)